MKGDLGGIFLESLGSVLGRLGLLLMALFTGGVIGLCSLMIGVFAAEWRLGFPGMNLLQLVPALVVGMVNFLIAMWYLRSENAGIRAWGSIAIFQVVAIVGCTFKGLSTGWVAPTVTILTALMLTAMMVTGLWYLQRWLEQRWQAQLQVLELENARRREALKARFGTENTGFREMEEGIRPPQ